MVTPRELGPRVVSGLEQGLVARVHATLWARSSRLGTAAVLSSEHCFRDGTGVWTTCGLGKAGSMDS